MLRIPQLSEQSVLITGGARGLGLAMGVRLAQLGATVGLVDIDGDGVKESRIKVIDHVVDGSYKSRRQAAGALAERDAERRGDAFRAQAEHAGSRRR